MRVVIAAGGTAGHVFPGLSVASLLRDERDADVVFVGRADREEARLVPEAGFALSTIDARPLVRSFSLDAVRAPIAALRAAHRCRGIARGADVVVGMGGYASVPLALAARWERRPLVLHEQNAVPGLANRLAGRWSSAIALAFPEAAARFRRRRVVVTGNPIRAHIAGVPAVRERLAEEARRTFDLDPVRRTVVAFGGSQGALHLNRAIVGAARHLAAREDLQILLLTGRAHHREVVGGLPEHGGLIVRAEPFVARMDLVYAIADLAVSRAGAGTIAELTACGIPGLLVPYPYATGRHQEANARALVRAGGASLLLDDALDARSLTERIEEMLDGERLAAMAKASAGFGRPEAAALFADVIAAEAA